ncbi:MAG: hypothetical protein RLN60_05830 [Phycisphaerales bacterium]
MSEYLKRPRSILTIATVLAIAAVLVFFVVPKEYAIAQQPVELDAHTAETYLYRVGLGPETLAAAGVDANGAGEVVGDLVAYLESNLSSIESAQSAYANANAQHSRLLRAVRQGDDTGELLSQLQVAASTLATAESALESALDGLFSAATADLTELERGDIESIRGNQAHRGPVAFKVNNRSESAWLNIRSALVAERQALEEEESVPDLAATLLESVRGEPAVAAAQAAYDVRYDAVVSAINTALGAL